MATDSFAWMCPCGRLCGKRHNYCPDCRGHWTSGTPALQSTQIAQGLYGAGQLGLARPFEERKRCKEKAAATGLDKKCKAPRAKASKGQGKSKDKNAPADLVSPFAQSTTTPWPAPETSYAFPSAFSNQVPVTPVAQPSQSADAAYDAELIQAVKEELPDLSKATLRIQNAVAKAEMTTPKQLTSGLHKTSHAVGTATKELKNLRDAKVKHRERWIRHLQDSVKSWGATTEAIQRATDQFQQPHQEGQARPRFSPSDLGGAQQEGCGPRGRGTEPLGRRGHDHGPASAGGASGLCEGGHQGGDHGDLRWEEVPNVPAPKRQRSLEPFAGAPAAPAS